MERFSKLAAHALERSLTYAEEQGHTYMGSEHLLMGLIQENDGVASRLLVSKGITAQRVQEKLQQLVGVGSPTLLSINDITPRLEAILTRAGVLAKQFGFTVVGTDHLLMALCGASGSMACRLLEEFGQEPAKLMNQLQERMGMKDLPLQSDKGRKGGAPALKFAIDLCKEGSGSPLIGRERELRQLMSILVRKTKNNPCLIGEPGVGKTVIVEGLAQRIAAGEVPPALRQLEIRMLDLPAMIAGTKYRGEFEERLKGVLEEAEKDPRLVLFIDEMHILVGAGAAEGAIDAANILKPALARGKVKVIGATTLEEYRRYIEQDGALERRFAPIRVEEPSQEETMEILRGLRPGLEQHHGVEYPEESLEAAIRLSVRYLGDRFLPDKAIDLLDEAGAGAQLSAFEGQERSVDQQILQKQQQLDHLLRNKKLKEAMTLREEINQLRILKKEAPARRPQVTESRLAAIISQQTGIPLTDQGVEQLADLEQRLNSRLIGQQEGITALCRAVRRSRAGLNDPRRPSCTLLFCGPTGVGKTRLAQLLAKELFGKEEALLRYDMAEFTESHSVARLIGAPPGYLGFDRGGGLVSRVREHPYSILVFDEIEKAHPEVLNILLGVLDEGRLTDGRGKTADFRNCLLVLTSNLGSEALQKERLGFGAEPADDSRRAAKRAVTQKLRPEFLNRLDEIIVFRELGRPELVEIAALHLRELEKRLAEGGHTVTFAPEVAAEAVERGYDKRYGARAIQRLIEREITAPLSVRILQGDPPAGLLEPHHFWTPLTPSEGQACPSCSPSGGGTTYK